MFSLIASDSNTRNREEVVLRQPFRSSLTKFPFLLLQPPEQRVAYHGVRRPHAQLHHPHQAVCLLLSDIVTTHVDTRSIYAFTLRAMLQLALTNTFICLQARGSHLTLGGYGHVA